MNTTVRDFHRLYYASRVWQQTLWRGVQVFKCPLDLWIYQEILNEVRPDLVVESGTCLGGSALYLASICEDIGHGEVLTIDITAHPNRPEHRRLTYWTGSSTSPEAIDTVKRHIAPNAKVLVILDSDHSKAHVAQELALYGPLVSPGSYMIVEDGNVNGHPVVPEHGPGPTEAISEFLEGSKDFAIDRDREKFFVTFNPGGYLKKTCGSF
jgi:cephalosporin hydroxylase